MKFPCKVCCKDFSSERSLHAHIKSHDLFLAEYYTKYYPRYNLLTGDVLPFKNKAQYFGEDFSTRGQLIEWCKKENKEKVKKYILELLKKRIASRSLSVGPSHMELSLNLMPDIEIYQKVFGSYTSACNQAGVKPMFGSRMPELWYETEVCDPKIFIDTREQQPLSFNNCESMKLDVGDYVTGGKDYNYTYVDRKSEQDFKSTLSKNSLERFRAELERAKSLDAYLFVVTEGSIQSIEKNNKWAPHKSSMKYIYHNMRVLAHEFAGHCQFIFTGSRENSEKIIPKILVLGKEIWGVDLQYYIDREQI